MNDRLRALAVLLAVFLLGCLVSGGLFYFCSAHLLPDRPGPFGFREPPLPMEQVLNLSSDQRIKFREIMNESREKFDAAMAENAPKLRVLRAEMHDKLLAILDEEQKKKFEEFTKQFENRRGDFKRRILPF